MRRFIVTVPGRGYRFIAELGEAPTSPVLPQTASAAVPASIPAAGNFPRRRLMVLGLVGLVALSLLAGWLVVRKRRAEASTAAIRTIAVLPFKGLSTESSDASLEMGMAETLINRLSGLRQLIVRPITSVRKYSSPEQDPVKAGQETQAQAVLDGNIQKAGDRIRVTVRLIDVRKDDPLHTAGEKRHRPAPLTFGGRAFRQRREERAPRHLRRKREHRAEATKKVGRLRCSAGRIATLKGSRYVLTLIRSWRDVLTLICS